MPAVNCEPVIGCPNAFTTGMLLLFAVELKEPEVEINTENAAAAVVEFCLTSNTSKPY